MESTETSEGDGSPVRTPSAGGIAASAPSERRGHDLATVGRSLDCAKAGVQSAALIAATARTLRGLGRPVTAVDSTTNVEQMTYRRRSGLPVLFDFTTLPGVTRSTAIGATSWFAPTCGPGGAQALAVGSAQHRSIMAVHRMRPRPDHPAASSRPCAGDPPIRWLGGGHADMIPIPVSPDGEILSEPVR
jgi:hypothetical protein